MQISSNSNAYDMSEVQRLLASLTSQNATSSGQDLPSATSGANGPPDGPPPGPPPGGDSQASSRFAANTLSSLLGVQQDPASSLATSLIGQADTDGDGSLSLSEIEKAISGGDSTGTAASTSSTGASSTDPLAAAFAKLDTDGDGKLSSSELTSAIKAHHGHHHHHQPQGTDASTATATTAAATATDTVTTAVVATETTSSTTTTG